MQTITDNHSRTINIEPFSGGYRYISTDGSICVGLSTLDDTTALTILNQNPPGGIQPVPEPTPNVIYTTPIIKNEEPLGVVNGNNTNFQITELPIPDTLSVFINGLLQVPGSSNDYILNNNNIIFNNGSIPKIDDSIYTVYQH